MGDNSHKKEVKDLFTKKYGYFFVNDYQNDPCLYVLNNQTGRAFVFDLGEITTLSSKMLLKVDTVFITHAHMDHLIGFDDLLRINIPCFKLRTLIGPEGISERIYHRIMSYSWNLLEKDQLQFLVKEIRSTGIKSFLISNTNGFIPQPVEDRKETSIDDTCVLTMDNKDKVYSLILDHGIESIGYLYQTASGFKVDSSKVDEIGAVCSKWVSELISKVEQAQFNDWIQVELKDGGSSRFRVDELYHKILEVVPSRSFGYITDFYFSESNIKKLISKFYGIDMLFCESTFMDEDYKKAHLKKHLTTYQAALIGAYLRVEDMRIFHFSKSYPNSEMIISEFRGFFDRYRKEDPSKIEQLINKELQRIK